MDLKELSNAWLSPDGEIVVDHEEFMAEAWHEQLARCIVKDMLQLPTLHAADDAVGLGYAYEYLEARGWLRLCSFQNAVRAKWVIADHRPTPSQREVIESWCAENDRTWEDSVDDL